MSAENGEGAPDGLDLEALAGEIRSTEEFDAILKRVASSGRVEDGDPQSFADQLRELVVSEGDLAPFRAIADKLEAVTGPALEAIARQVQDMVRQAAEPIQGQLNVTLPSITVPMQGNYVPPREPETSSVNAAGDGPRTQSTRLRFIGASGLYVLVFGYLADALDIENKAHLQILAVCITLTLLLANEALKNDN